MMLMLLAMAASLDINQGVYLCPRADAQTVAQLEAEPNDRLRRGPLARKLGCTFHMAGPTNTYVEAYYPVTQEVLDVCHRRSEGFCDTQSRMVRIQMPQGSTLAIVTWRDEDRD